MLLLKAAFILCIATQVHLASFQILDEVNSGEWYEKLSTYTRFTRDGEKECNGTCSTSDEVCEENMCRKIYIGEVCESTANCAHITEADCINKTCECKEGFSTNENFTSCIIPPGHYDAACNHTDDCKYDNAECIEKMCKCKQNFTYIKNSCAPSNGEILLPITVETSPSTFIECDDNKTCAIKNASCVDNVCICPNGTIKEQDKCQTIDIKYKIGSQCTELNQCPKYSTCNGTCQCAGNLTATPDLMSCVILTKSMMVEKLDRYKYSVAFTTFTPKPIQGAAQIYSSVTLFIISIAITLFHG